jgi:hypothetical protein
VPPTWLPCRTAPCTGSPTWKQLHSSVFYVNLFPSCQVTCGSLSAGASWFCLSPSQATLPGTSIRVDILSAMYHRFRVSTPCELVPVCSHTGQRALLFLGRRNILNRRFRQLAWSHGICIHGIRGTPILPHQVRTNSIEGEKISNGRSHGLANVRQNPHGLSALQAADERIVSTYGTAAANQERLIELHHHMNANFLVD